MVSVNYDILNELIACGNWAYEFAWANYEMLNNRNASYVLYGPPTNYIGVMAAGHLTPARERKVLKQTRRKNYIMYEFDQYFQILRVRHVCNYNQIDCTYHMFEHNGVIYGCPFWQDKKIRYPAKTVAVMYDRDRPVYFAMTSREYLCVDYYEYPQPDRVKTTCYLYLPTCTYSSTGLQISKDAPFGAQNSPVTIDFCEEEYNHIDFSLHFK